MKNLRLLLAIIGASITQIDSTRFVNSKVTGISVEGLNLVSGAIIPGGVVRHSAMGNESADMTHPVEVERSPSGQFRTTQYIDYRLEWKGWIL